MTIIVNNVIYPQKKRKVGNLSTFVSLQRDSHKFHDHKRLPVST